MHPGALARRRAEALQRMASTALEISEKLNEPALTDLAAKIQMPQAPSEELRGLFRTEALADLLDRVNALLPTTEETLLEPVEGEQADNQELPPARRRGKRGQ